MTTLQNTPPTTQTSVIANAGQYLTFGLNGETYAVSLLSVKEIISYDSPTEVPMTPSFIRGVINIRGKVVPIIDLLARFSQGTTNIAKRTSIVIVETVDRLSENVGEGSAASHITDIGIIVDAVNEVIDINTDAIEPAPSFGAHIRPDFIVGMAKLEDRFMVILAVDRVLAVDEMAALGKSLLPH